MSSRDGSNDRRNHPRSDLKIKVRYSSVNKFLSEYTSNISQGGAFVATKKPLPVGTRMLIEMEVPGLDGPIEVIGEVRWNTDVQPRTETSGMGIAFVYRSEDEKREFEKKVLELFRRELGEYAYQKFLEMFHNKDSE